MENESMVMAEKSWIEQSELLVSESKTAGNMCDKNGVSYSFDANELSTSVDPAANGDEICETELVVSEDESSQCNLAESFNALQVSPLVALDGSMPAPLPVPKEQNCILDMIHDSIGRNKHDSTIAELALGDCLNLLPNLFNASTLAVLNNQDFFPDTTEYGLLTSSEPHSPPKAVIVNAEVPTYAPPPTRFTYITDAVEAEDDPQTPVSSPRSIPKHIRIHTDAHSMTSNVQIDEQGDHPISSTVDSTNATPEDKCNGMNVSLTNSPNRNIKKSTNTATSTSTHDDDSQTNTSNGSIDRLENPSTPLSSSPPAVKYEHNFSTSTFNPRNTQNGKHQFASPTKTLSKQRQAKQSSVTLLPKKATKQFPKKKPLTSNSIFTTSTSRSNTGSQVEPKSRECSVTPNVKFKKGDRVSCEGRTEGASAIVRYVGTTEFALGDWVGLELPEADGKHDGTVGGRSYFKCMAGHGTQGFVYHEQVM
eukprot:CFRG7037T1